MPSPRAVKQPSLFTFGGEFRQQSHEAKYREAHFPESIRYIRLLFLAAFLINILFFLNDWHFFGQPHFSAAISARAVIVVVSIICCRMATAVQNFRQFQILGIAWGVPCILASAVLVTPHSDAALFIIFILPIIFYLALPISFPWTVALGVCCSAATLASYIASAAAAQNNLGLGLGMLTNNVVLALVLNRSNRLQRQEWAATVSAQAANRELSENRQLLQSILQAIPAPLIIINQETGEFLQANEAARRYLGDAFLLDPLALKKYFKKHDIIKLSISLQQHEQVAEHETRITMPNGSSRDVLLVATKAVIGGIAAIVTVIIDITNRKEMEQHLQLLASTDPLTGLANRSRFFSLATTEIKRSQRFGHPLTVIMFDIDFFKHINDTFGHEAGDRTLRNCANLCRSLVREHDTVARIGGEEFALLLPETDPANARILAERFRMAVEKLLVEHDTGITVSLGIAAVRPGETAVDAALSRADQAMYAAKNAGRNRTVLHGELPEAAGEAPPTPRL